MPFEWDEEKRQTNLKKHGVDFLRAQDLFDGRPATVLSHHPKEERYLTTGELDSRLYTAVWARRGDVIRIISVRRAHNADERTYRALYGR